MSHTPGPWEEDLSADGEHMARMIAANRDWGAVATVSEDHGHVAYCHYSNASLIAAAPELLRELKFAVSVLQDNHIARGVAAGLAAIRKAEGRTEG